MDATYEVVDALFGPDSGIPWWAWMAPVLLIFARLLYAVMFPEAAAAEAEADRRLAEFRKHREDQGGKPKKGKKSKK